VVEQSRRWLDEWRLGNLIAQAFREFGLSESVTAQAVAAIHVMTTHQRWFELRDRRTSRARLVVKAWLADDATRQFLQIHRYNEIVWFNKEAFQALVGGMLAVAFIRLSAGKRPQRKKIVAAYAVIKALLQAEKKSKYQVDKLLTALR
jgi:hypothetical protein